MLGVPLMSEILFENKNVAISKTINNIEFDFYGNINFETLK